jgi:hypothetical protein
MKILTFKCLDCGTAIFELVAKIEVYPTKTGTENKLVMSFNPLNGNEIENIQLGDEVKVGICQNCLDDKVQGLDEVWGMNYISPVEQNLTEIKEEIKIISLRMNEMRDETKAVDLMIYKIQLNLDKAKNYIKDFKELDADP